MAPITWELQLPKILSLHRTASKGELSPHTHSSHWKSRRREGNREREKELEGERSVGVASGLQITPLAAEEEREKGEK